jgi:hypothetical protein
MNEPTDRTARNEQLARQSALTSRLEVLALLESHVEGRADDFEALILAPHVSDAELFTETLALLAGVLTRTGTYDAVVSDIRSRTLAELGRA